jgi:hypothetical protein
LLTRMVGIVPVDDSLELPGPCALEIGDRGIESWAKVGAARQPQMRIEMMSRMVCCSREKRIAAVLYWRPMLRTTSRQNS